MSEPIIELKDITAGYDKKVVLQGVNLSVRSRDFLGIIGPNGGGKTTLVKLILGLLTLVSGEIHFYRDGKEVDTLAMGYLPQYNAIDRKFPISVEEVIFSGLSSKHSLLGGFTAEEKESVRRVVSEMGLEGIEKKAIGKLSGGQLQRTLLGRALVSDPDVVILDEPNTYIDKGFEARLYEMLEEVNKERAIILVSHDIGAVLQNVKSIACVNGTLDYHGDSEGTGEWLEKNFHCPIELVAHGKVPHRVLKDHNHTHGGDTNLGHPDPDAKDTGCPNRER
ncbi:MAG: metal ABC transporter ATP-binding protein [Bacteroides sp.]|nr:metal ABC transporter ATP-binding protein [Bacteroides sp.]